MTLIYLPSLNSSLNTSPFVLGIFKAITLLCKFEHLLSCSPIPFFISLGQCLKHLILITVMANICPEYPWMALILNILLCFQPMGGVISPDFYLENMVTKLWGLSHQTGSSLKAGVGS